MHQPPVRPPARVFVVCLLVVAGTVVWRRGTIFSGGLDAVVVGKAVVSVIALLIAAATVRSGGPLRRLGTGSLWFLVAVLLAGLLGALGHGTLLAGGVVAVRVLILVATVFLLLRSTSGADFFAGVVWASGSIAALAAVTGFPHLSSGRLEGGLPPLNPNELAALAAVVVLWVAWRALLGAAGPADLVVAVAFTGVLWATGSRTALVVLVVAVVVMVVQVRRLPVGLVVGGLITVGLGALAAVSTGAVGEFAERDGAGASTLAARFIAWRASLTWAEGPWQTAFGGGLSVKLIPVEGQHWDTQLLDSSWVSALVQSGVVGLAVALAWALWTCRGVLHVPPADRLLLTGLLTFVLGRSVLESGLFDATPMALTFVAVALLAERGSRARPVVDDLGAALPGRLPSAGR
ncbi:hypothetical protein [Blastococcus montanus]|uniref:hypothetical protein n=1 Tax=Blastococcus montanus TaxID=3144973 RepID=UPI00320B54C4